MAPRLTTREIESVLAAAGNVDPCMFDEKPDATPEEKDRDRRAWETGQSKLRQMLALRKKE